MKYYYGNDYKEAISNPPAEISSERVLRQYQDNYNVVIPADAVDDGYDIELDDDAYEFDETTGTLAIDKQVFDDFEEDTAITIHFADEGDMVSGQYKMTDEDMDYIYCEYLGD